MALVPHMQVEEVLLCFTRDPQVLKNRDAAAGGPAVLAASRSGALTPFPPAGVLPLRGMSMLVYPLCYLYAQQAIHPSRDPRLARSRP